jgi:hypothetical protein
MIHSCILCCFASSNCAKAGQLSSFCGVCFDGSTKYTCKDLDNDLVIVGDSLEGDLELQSTSLYSNLGCALFSTYPLPLLSTP